MPARSGQTVIIGGCGTVGHIMAPFLVVEGQRLSCISADLKSCDCDLWDDYTRCDTTDLGSVFDTLRGKDSVVFAALGDFYSPKSLFEVGVFGFYNVMLVSKEIGLRRVVLLSSMSVYDDWADGDLKSESKPAACDDSYGVVKVLAEATGRHFAEAYGMSVIALRLAAPMEEEVAAYWRYIQKYALSASQIARVVEAAVLLEDHVGFDAVHVCGNPDKVNMVKAKELLAWEP